MDESKDSQGIQSAEGAGILRAKVFDANAMLRQIVESSVDCIKILDLDGNLLSMNEGGRKLLEIQDLSKYLNSCWTEWWSETDRKEAANAVAAARAGGTGRFVAFANTAAGTPKWWEVVVTPIPGANGKPEHLLSISRDITQQSDYHRRHQESEERFRVAFAHSSVGIVIADLDGRVLEANDAYLKIIGWQRADLIGKTSRNITHPDDNQGTLDALQQIRSGAVSSVVVEKRYLRPNGEVVWAHASLALCRDSTGQAQTLMAVVQDVTEFRKTNDALRDSEARFRQLADAMPQIVFSAHPDGHVDYFNKRWYEYTGQPEGSVGFENWKDVHTEDGLKRVSEAWPEALRSGTPYEIEYPLRRHDGVYRWHLGRALPVRDSSGKIVRWFGTNTDIHDHKMATEALAESEARYRLATRAVNNVIRDWDLVAGQVRWNESLETMLGHTPNMEQLAAEWWLANIYPEDLSRVSESIHRVIDDPNAEHWQEEYRFQRADGTYADVLDRGYVLRDANNRAVRMLGAMQDLSERKRFDRDREQMLRAEQTARAEAERAGRMKEEFLATVSHELRTPLNAILGWTQIIKRKGFNPDDVSRGLDVIERNARAQSQLIEDLLDMSRIISGKIRLTIEKTDLTSVLNAALDTVQHSADTKGLTLTSWFDPRVSHVSGDAGRLQQVFWNLLSNAIKFTPKGGTVQLMMRATGDAIEVQVIDSGEGLKADLIPHVFDRFRQGDADSKRSHGGLGLGLSIVKHLVELHGGNVRAASAGLGLGSTFTVTLPTSGPAHAVMDGQSTPNQSPLTGVSALVVDDEADLRHLLQRLLEEQGATVHLAASAADGLENLQSKLPDVLISDIGMPGEDGLMLIKRVRGLDESKGGNTPALALTAYARDEDRNTAILAGYQLHMKKPFDPAELLAAVVSLSRRSRA